MRSSMPMASAQPMSLPPVFQFGRSLQGHHRSPRTMPMPVVELASENPLTSVTTLPPGMSLEREGERRTSSHQARSSLSVLGGCRDRKGRP